MILGVLQARTSSSRLPGKVLKPILGVPMILRQIERLAMSARMANLVVATTDDPSDDGLAALCMQERIAVFRGSRDDVLDRVYRASLAQAATHVVRLTADCPLADPEVVDAVIELHMKAGADYTSNVLPPSYPDGLDVEVVTCDALRQAWHEARLPSEREHVTSFVQERPERFKIRNLVREQDLSQLRWTVDEPRDFAFVVEVFRRLYPANPRFASSDILALLSAYPELGMLNSGIGRNEGSRASAQADRQFLNREPK